jgi:predicted hydrocarbon binding protein
MTPSDAGLLAVSPSIFLYLRQSLERTVGGHGPQVLQEAGFSSGDQVFDAFRLWLSDNASVGEPEDLDAVYLGAMLSRFFSEHGWGTLEIERIGPAALAIDALNWVENTRGETEDLTGPVCHFSTGLFAALFGRLGEDVVAVMEVDPPEDDSEKCRFLLGSPETLQAVFDAMSHGADYHSVLATADQADA